MKQKRIEKKLVLNKKTVADLSRVDMDSARGGTIYSVFWWQSCYTCQTCLECQTDDITCGLMCQTTIG